MAKKYWVDPPQNNVLLQISPTFFTGFSSWFSSISDRLGANPMMIKTYTVASLPDADKWGDTSFTSIVGVSDDATDGYVLAYSDGSTWKKVKNDGDIA